MLVAKCVQNVRDVFSGRRLAFARFFPSFKPTHCKRERGIFRVQLERFAVEKYRERFWAELFVVASFRAQRGIQVAKLVDEKLSYHKITTSIGYFVLTRSFQSFELFDVMMYNVCPLHRTRAILDSALIMIVMISKISKWIMRVKEAEIDKNTRTHTERGREIEIRDSKRKGDGDAGAAVNRQVTARKLKGGSSKRHITETCRNLRQELLPNT